MPSKTKRQAVAMRIAAAGKSSLGIPVKVAKEFVAADRKTGKFGKSGKSSTLGNKGRRKS